ncbi:UNVERIFIED_ORG: hypothetical protein GGI57_000641 [Rhizobium aethiopicum]
MYRITVSRLLMMMRLVIIVSLAGYSLSNANAAMHGSSFPELKAAVSDITPSDEGHDMTEAAHHGHSHGDVSDVSHDGDGASKLVKQECCKDFCGGFGIICEGPDVGGPVVTSIRQFADDSTALGELPALHRPPNI